MKEQNIKTTSAYDPYDPRNRNKQTSAEFEAEMTAAAQPENSAKLKAREIKPVERDSIIYNAADAKGFERGDAGKGKPKIARIYSVYRIQDNKAYCQSRNAWGEIFNEVFPIQTLVPYQSDAAVNA